MSSLLTGILYALASATAYSFYAISLKPFKERIILFFWVNIFVYLAYLSIYFFRTVILEYQPHPLHNLLFEFTFTNIPFYILTSCFWVGTLLMLNYLLEQFEVSLVMPVTEISILFILLGYIILGAKFSVLSLIGVTIVFIGAIISAFDKLSMTDPLGPLKAIPVALLCGGIIESLLESGTSWIAFICTHETAQTIGIHNWMNNMFMHIHHLPFSFHNPFYYNVGVRFFIALIFLSYIIIIKNTREKLLSTLFENKAYILIVGTFFATSVICYHTAFFILEDKSILTALTKLSIPMILVIGYFYLQEKITAPKIAGCALIIGGGIVSLLA